MSDVAARAGVSRALVSIVFRDAPGASVATRERVRRAAADLGYRPDRRARLLGSNRSRTVGVVFGLHDEFHGELVDELYVAIENSGYELALGVSGHRRRERIAVQNLLDDRCEALLLMGPRMPAAALADLAGQIPVVVLARSLRPDRSAARCDVVRTDDVAGGRLAAHHLASLGHRRIALVDGRRAPGSAERRRGHLETLRALGLAQDALVVPGGPEVVDGERAAAAVLASAATGVAAFNDHCAAGLMAALRADGTSIPGELSVVGYDDSSIAALGTVDLTTVAQDGVSLAAAAVRRLVARLEGADTAREVVIAPRLVERASTGPRVLR